MFVHTDRQLKATHLMLDYIPISKSFQAPRCVFKEKAHRLHWISVATPRFLTTSPVPEGVLTTGPILEGIPKVELPFQHAAEEEASSSQIQPRERKGSLKSLTLKTLKMTLRSSTNLCLLKPHQVTSAILFSHKQARHKETPPYLRIWVFNASPRRVSYQL